MASFSYYFHSFCRKKIRSTHSAENLLVQECEKKMLVHFVNESVLFRIVNAPNIKYCLLNSSIAKRNNAVVIDCIAVRYISNKYY